MEALDIEAIKNSLMTFLNESAGEFMTAPVIAKRTNQPAASTKHFLTELAEHGLIRRSGTRNSTTYYVPTKEQIEAESRVHVDRFRPLRPRPQMAERIAQLRAEREALPSLHCGVA